MSWTSFLNSMKPCPECEESLFTAISNPSGNWPWRKRCQNLGPVSLRENDDRYDVDIVVYFLSDRYDIFVFTYSTLQTAPKPPCPSLFSSEKLSVASSNCSNSNTENSDELFPCQISSSCAFKSLVRLDPASNLSTLVEYLDEILFIFSQTYSANRNKFKQKA